MRKDIKQLEKYCLYCGKPLCRKRYNGRLEDFTVFTKRKFCDSDCMAKYRLTNTDDGSSWSSAHTTARKINDKIIHGDKCEICGSSTNIDVHHIDFNWKNNSIDNLQVVCRSCHMKIHNPKGVCMVCGRPLKGLGYCDKHYQRYKKYSCPLKVAYHKDCKNCIPNKVKIDECIEKRYCNDD